jgi:dTDP-4-amino-4,6-dideoxygalactose transaminase
MGTQPMYIKEYGEFSTPNALDIDNRGIYIPNHPKLSITEITRMLETIKKAL